MQLFTFIYSKRAGTRAAEMPDPTPRSEKTERIARLCALQDEIVQELAGALIGTVQRVLVEGEGRESGVLVGRLDNNSTVEFAGDRARIGAFADVRIEALKGAVLKGTLL